MAAVAYDKGMPHQSPSAKEIADINEREQAGHGAPARTSAYHQVGGSRPGVESRVKEAIDVREAREDEENAEKGGSR